MLLACHETERAPGIHGDEDALAFRSGGDGTAVANSDALAVAYTTHAKGKPGESCLVLVHWHADVHALNHAILPGLQATGLCSEGMKFHR